MEEVYKKELGVMKWIARLTERLTIITTSMRIKQDLGITEEDREIIEALGALRENGPLLMYETITVNKEEDSQSVTQTNLFTDETTEQANSSTAGKSVTAKVDCIGMEIEPLMETKKKKK